MYPVFGPYYSVYTSGDESPRAKVVQRWMYMQRKPYNLPLPYKAIIFISKAGIGPRWDAGVYGGSHVTPVTFDTNGDGYFPYYESYENATVTKAVSAFNKGQENRAALGVTMVQHREAVSMIAKRVKQLYQVFSSLKKLDLAGACRALNLSLWQAKRNHQQWVRQGKGGPFSLKGQDIWSQDWAKTKDRKRLKAVSGLWLEFSFGWAPLVDDLSTAVKVINDRPVYLAPLKARANMRWSYENNTTSNDQFWQYRTKCLHKVWTKVMVGGTLTVTNSNYSLASSLGLTNLGSVLYEAVPFSFIANYFINLEQYLQQSSQYDGVTVTQSWYTIVWEDNITFKRDRTHLPSGNVYVDNTYEGMALSQKRITGSLPVIKLGLRHGYHNGIKRALNNASLLAQLFIKR